MFPKVVWDCLQQIHRGGAASLRVSVASRGTVFEPLQSVRRLLVDDDFARWLLSSQFMQTRDAAVVAGEPLRAMSPLARLSWHVLFESFSFGGPALWRLAFVRAASTSFHLILRLSDPHQPMDTQL
jgi:hypothetical protein